MGRQRPLGSEDSNHIRDMGDKLVEAKRHLDALRDAKHSGMNCRARFSELIGATNAVSEALAHAGSIDGMIPPAKDDRLSSRLSRAMARLDTATKRFERRCLRAR